MCFVNKVKKFKKKKKSCVIISLINITNMFYKGLISHGEF